MLHIFKNYGSVGDYASWSGIFWKLEENFSIWREWQMPFLSCRYHFCGTAYAFKSSVNQAVSIFCRLTVHTGPKSKFYWVWASLSTCKWFERSVLEFAWFIRPGHLSGANQEANHCYSSSVTASTVSGDITIQFCEHRNEWIGESGLTPVMLVARELTTYTSEFHIAIMDSINSSTKIQSFRIHFSLRYKQVGFLFNNWLLGKNCLKIGCAIWSDARFFQNNQIIHYQTDFIRWSIEQYHRVYVGCLVAWTLILENDSWLWNRYY